MWKNRFLTIATLAAIIATLTLGFCDIHFSSAFAPTEDANPRLIYWPPTSVWKTGNWIYIDKGWINARSMAWSPSGRYLLIYGDIYLMSISLQGLRVIIVDMDSGNVAYNFSSEVTYWGFDRFTQFAFSPDGTKIFFANASSSYLPSAILATNFDGTGLSKIVDFNVTSMGDVLPQISIDVTSNGLLVYSFCQRIGYANYTSYIWKYNLATGEKSLVLRLNGSDAIITSFSIKR